VIALLLAVALPFPLEAGAVWVYREAYAEKRGAVDVISEDETRFEVRARGARRFVVQAGGADPAGTVPVETGDGWVRLGPWTGDEALPVPLEVGRSGPPAENGRPGWIVEAEEQVSVPAGTFQAFRCALRTWSSESVLWIAPGVGVVRETQGSPGARPEIERVLLRATPAR
jgi:hypothetical protein